ncbi:MAG: polymerase III, subunit gamma/tau protein [Parcubacteria group bacterium GW2011_GWA2_51_12]|nr:MAG: polymerase III, subunit gamma/tau protein [Parcubacteria group bacterium GW2011_GWA2_51_12]
MPETEFKRTVGHDRIKKLFLQGMTEGRLKQSYALIGPSHVGKTTFALELAEILGAHPVLDVVIHEQEGADSHEFGIEDARRMQGALSLSPVGRYKVGIVSRGENMTREAANSLLKFLEEPPARAMFFLVTNNGAGLPETVSSRVQKIHFGKNTEIEIRGVLENLEVAEPRLLRLTELARGRIGLAITMLNDDTLFAFEERAGELYDVFLKGSVSDRLQSAQFLAESRIIFGGFLEYAMERVVADSGPGDAARKLLTSWKELPLNLNLKLSTDILFLPN